MPYLVVFMKPLPYLGSNITKCNYSVGYEATFTVFELKQDFYNHGSYGERQSNTRKLFSHQVCVWRDGRYKLNQIKHIKVTNCFASITYIVQMLLRLFHNIC
jgi:hypothetical protein